MPFLTIAGTTIPVSVAGASKKSLERIGSSSRAFAGGLRSTVRAEKRVWQFTTRWLTEAEAAVIEALYNNAEFVSCAGDALGATISCEVTQSDSPMVAIAGSGTFKRQLTLILREV